MTLQRGFRVKEKNTSSENFSPYTQTKHVVEDKEGCDSTGNLCKRLRIIEALCSMREDAS